MRSTRRLNNCIIYGWTWRVLLVCLILACGRGEPASLEQIIQARPQKEGAIFDYVGIMADVEESARRYLETIKTRYGIEILIVALPSLENRYTVNDAAAEMFTRWEIGKACDGRGILLLFVDDEKRVKLEVSYDLEDVFTDAFTGHIQDVQLQPRYTAGQLAVGFIAVMEALESRAQVKYGGNYTPAGIAKLDLAYLSQGAGALGEIGEIQFGDAGRGIVAAVLDLGAGLERLHDGDEADCQLTGSIPGLQLDILDVAGEGVGEDILEIVADLQFDTLFVIHE